MELGIDRIDTAEFYGDGVVNRAIRTALYPYPDGLQLVSKIGAEHTDAGLVPAQRPEQLRAAIEANLRQAAPPASPACRTSTTCWSVMRSRRCASANVDTARIELDDAAVSAFDGLVR